MTDTFPFEIEYEKNQLIQLACELDHAKRQEELAKFKRVEAENRIAALIETDDVGQKTVTLENGIKITVKRALNYTADTDAIREAFSGQVKPAPMVQKTTWSLDVKGYEWYRRNWPEFFKLIEPHVSVKPAKVAVTLKMPE